MTSPASYPTSTDTDKLDALAHDQRKAQALLAAEVADRVIFPGKVLPNGFTVLEVRRASTYGVECLVLAYSHRHAFATNRGPEYAVWRADKSDDRTTGNGFYTSRLDKALENLEARTPKGL